MFKAINTSQQIHTPSPKRQKQLGSQVVSRLGSFYGCRAVKLQQHNCVLCLQVILRIITSSAHPSVLQATGGSSLEKQALNVVELARSPHATLTQVTFPCNNSVTVRAVKLRHILRVLLQDVHLHRSTLSEASVTNVTLIGFLTFQKREEKWLSPRGSLGGRKLIRQNDAQRDPSAELTDQLTRGEEPWLSSRTWALQAEGPRLSPRHLQLQKPSGCWESLVQGLESHCYSPSRHYST